MDVSLPGQGVRGCGYQCSAHLEQVSHSTGLSHRNELQMGECCGFLNRPTPLYRKWRETLAIRPSCCITIVLVDMDPCSVSVTSSPCGPGLFLVGGAPTLVDLTPSQPYFLWSRYGSADESNLCKWWWKKPLERQLGRLALACWHRCCKGGGKPGQ